MVRRTIFKLWGMKYPSMAGMLFWGTMVHDSLEGRKNAMKMNPKSSCQVFLGRLKVKNLEKLKS